MIIIRMSRKPGIDGASADFAQPFQFGEEGVRTCAICEFDVLNRLRDLHQLAILCKRQRR